MDIQLEKSQFYLFNAVVCRKITPQFNEFTQIRGNIVQYSLYRIPRECFNPRNSFHLVHVTESASWDEQFPGLGKHQGNALSRYCETRNYLSQFLLWTTSNMNGDCELYLCFHFHPETTRNENRLLDKRKREFNLKAFARTIHKFSWVSGQD